MLKKCLVFAILQGMKLPSALQTQGFPTLLGLSFIIFGWFALSLTLGSLFSFPFIVFGFVLCFALTLFIAFHYLRSSAPDLRLAFLLALISAVGIGFISEPTIFSGRDQGSIAEAAYRLAQNTELPFSTPASDAFFEIYGKGTALNFPGFAYTENGLLITQFPLAYTAWLGSFVSLFGLSGFAIGNAILLFLFFFFFYHLLRLFVHPYYAFAGLLLSLASFLPSWFAKFTLTENMALFLFVFLSYSLVLFFRTGKFLFYSSVLLAGGLFAFTRIEGFAFLFLALALMAFHPHTRALFRTYPWKSIVIPGILFAFFLLRDLFINIPYYKMIGKALNKFLERSGDSTATLVSGVSASLGSIFFVYGFLALVLLGFFGILLFLRRKHWALLIPAGIALPTFLYLFQPNITPDHPWMLRRYLFSLYPTLLFSAVLGIALLFSHTRSLPVEAPKGKRLFFASLIFLGLITLELPAFTSQIAFAEHRTLQNQITSFASEFSDTDLILVDRNVTGDGFAMLSGPAQFLSGKNMVYFFNPYDLAALDTSRFERVFLLTPEESQGRYAAVFGEKLARKGTITFSLEQYETLSLSSDALRLPEKEILHTQNILFQIY